MLATALERFLPSGSDNLCIRFDRIVDGKLIDEAIARLRPEPPRLAAIRNHEQVMEELKFSACIPRHLAERMLSIRLSDPHSVEMVLAKPVRIIRTQERASG